MPKIFLMALSLLTLESHIHESSPLTKQSYPKGPAHRTRQRGTLYKSKNLAPPRSLEREPWLMMGDGVVWGTTQTYHFTAKKESPG